MAGNGRFHPRHIQTKIIISRHSDVLTGVNGRTKRIHPKRRRTIHDHVPRRKHDAQNQVNQLVGPGPGQRGAAWRRSAAPQRNVDDPASPLPLLLDHLRLGAVHEIRIAQLGLRYVISIDGATTENDWEHHIEGGGGYGSFAWFGYGKKARRTYIDVTIWDLEEPASSGDLSDEKSGASYYLCCMIPFFYVPSTA